MFKLLVSVVIALTVLLGPLGALAAELKIGVVDANGLLMNSSEGKRVQESIKKKAEELGRPLGTKRQELARQVEDFQKQAGVMKEDARKAKAQELDKKMQDFEKQASDADKQLAQFKESQLGPLSKKLEQAINQVAAENKLDLVLDKAMLLGLPNTSLDYTDKVRAKFGS